MMLRSCSEYGPSQRGYPGWGEWHAFVAAQHAEFPQTIFAVAQWKKYDTGIPGAS